MLTVNGHPVLWLLDLRRILQGPAAHARAEARSIRTVTGVWLVEHSVHYTMGIRFMAPKSSNDHGTAACATQEVLGERLSLTIVLERLPRSLSVLYAVSALEHEHASSFFVGRS